jgi:hypothetical protein
LLRPKLCRAAPRRQSLTCYYWLLWLWWFFRCPQNSPTCRGFTFALSRSTKWTNSKHKHRITLSQHYRLYNLEVYDDKVTSHCSVFHHPESLKRSTCEVSWGENQYLPVCCYISINIFRECQCNATYQRHSIISPTCLHHHSTYPLAQYREDRKNIRRVGHLYLYSTTILVVLVLYYVLRVWMESTKKDQINGMLHSSRPSRFTVIEEHTLYLTHYVYI